MNSTPSPSPPSPAHDPRRRRDPASFRPDPQAVKAQSRQNIAEWVILICVAIIGALLIKMFVLQMFWIPSESMEPTLEVGDRIVVDKLSYRFGSIHRGDIVVFRRPPAEEDESIHDLVKRVIALPGDTVEVHGGVLYRNSEVVKEPYLPPGTQTKELPPTKVPEGQLWVMGDNRTRSADSRYFGAVDKKLVVGKAVVRVWPLSNIGGL